MRMLLTGPTGFVGSALCPVLLGRGYEVRAAFRSPPIEAPDCEAVVVGGIDASTDWSGPLQGVAVVVHLAARVHVMHESATNPAQAFRQTNVDATLNLARQAAQAGVKRLVFMSSVKANGERTLPGKPYRETDTLNPQDDYGRSKCEAEQQLSQLANETGLEVVIIRPPLVYGPGVKANFAALMRLVARGWPLPFGSIANRRSLVGLGNLVDFIALCIVHPAAANQVYLVSDGHDMSTTELVRAMARAAGVRARLLPIPASALLLAARVLGQSAAMHRLCDNLQVDISKAREQLQWSPPFPVDVGLGQAYQARYKP